jgi:hypothetical protein
VENGQWAAESGGATGLAAHGSGFRRAQDLTGLLVPLDLPRLFRCELHACAGQDHEKLFARRRPRSVRGKRARRNQGAVIGDLLAFEQTVE